MRASRVTKAAGKLVKIDLFQPMILSAHRVSLKPAFPIDRSYGPPFIHGYWRQSEVLKTA